MDIVFFIEFCSYNKVVEVDMVIMEKKGIFIGVMVVYFISGEEVFVWIVNFVLMDYGFGVVMLVLVYD